MSKYTYSKIEQQINKVLMYQQEELSGIRFPEMKQIDAQISRSETILRSLGYDLDRESLPRGPVKQPVLIVPTWESLCREAESRMADDIALDSIFTDEELELNGAAISKMRQEFNAIHRLDKYDIAISAAAALAAAAVDILMVGIPVKTPDGLCAGTLSNYIRSEFDKHFPEDEMQKLAASSISKVPYDAQDNRHTAEYVTGLSAYYHRLLSLGHDPILGFAVGVFDILTGRMTTIDKSGRVASQVMEVYSDRKERDLFAALAKQVLHLKSDLTTSMGLPAPMMSLFNFLQFGEIGEYDQTIAEIVQGMYYGGYDFIHFCSMSVPVMLAEVIVRIGYAFKRIKEGHELKDAIPVSTDHEKNPKLGTMLFMAHSGAAAVNAGKVFFTENPMAINYPQWIAFTKYSYQQLKWVLIRKPELQSRYVEGKLFDDRSLVLTDIDKAFEELSQRYVIIME